MKYSVSIAIFLVAVYATANAKYLLVETEGDDREGQGLRGGVHDQGDLPGKLGQRCYPYDRNVLRLTPQCAEGLYCKFKYTMDCGFGGGCGVCAGTQGKYSYNYKISVLYIN